MFADGRVPTNLLMVSIDTLRRDRLARYGGAGTMPFIDALAADGVALDDHAGCSNWTFHATTCVLRGSDPLEWGFVPYLLDEGGIREDVPPGTDFLATWLGAAGFTSVLVTTNALLSLDHGNGVGYDLVEEAPGLGTTPASAAAAEALGRLEEIAPTASRWFLHLHLMEPHRPYDPPPEYLAGLEDLPPVPYDLTTFDGHDQAVWDSLNGMSAEDRAVLEQHMRLRYDGEAAWLDAQLGAWFAELGAGGWLDDALVVVWSDHGEQLWEHGYEAHAFTLFGEENDAILLFSAPGLAPAAWTRPTWQGDLAPTLLDLYRQPVPEVVTGLPLGRAPDDRPRFAFTRGKVGAFQSVRTGSDHLHFGWQDPAAVEPWMAPSQGVRYHDRASDPAEAVDRYDPADPRVLAAWELLLPRIEAAAVLLPDEPLHWPEGLPR